MEQMSDIHDLLEIYFLVLFHLFPFQNTYSHEDDGAEILYKEVRIGNCYIIMYSFFAIINIKIILLNLFINKKKLIRYTKIHMM